MSEDIRRRKPMPDQMNIRLGSKYIQNFNLYMEKHGGKKIDFIRDALDYWMSVDGKDPGANQLLEKLIETQTNCEERIGYLNRIIHEKDERIKILQKRIDALDAESK